MFARVANWLRRQNVFLLVVITLLAGVGGGLAMWGGFNYVAAATSSNAFCTSCHEMQENAAEYHRSLHYMNVYGVRAQCADCHVPKPFFKRVVHMIGALRDVEGHITGVIDTPAKFKAHRLAMAKRVWAEMEADNSIGCRSCHSFEAMDFAKQPKAASMAMHPAMEAGQTCISCHRGIVHDLPQMSTAAASIAPLFPTTKVSEDGAADAMTVTTTPFYLPLRTLPMPQAEPARSGPPRRSRSSIIRVRLPRSPCGAGRRRPATRCMPPWDNRLSRLFWPPVPPGR